MYVCMCVVVILRALSINVIRQVDASTACLYIRHLLMSQPQRIEYCSGSKQISVEIIIKQVMIKLYFAFCTYKII